jgi:hypothetical protein
MAEADVPPPPVLSVPAKRNPASAIWSLILGILSVVCAGVFAAVPAVICGHVARAAIRNSRGELGGEGLALAGLILGYAAIVLNIILVPTIVVPVLQKKFAESNGVTGFNNAIVSADGMERILAPANWKSLSGLNKDASIAAGNESQEEYLVVISENKADLAVPRWKSITS